MVRKRGLVPDGRVPEPTRLQFRFLSDALAELLRGGPSLQPVGDEMYSDGYSDI